MKYFYIRTDKNRFRIKIKKRTGAFGCSEQLIPWKFRGRYHPFQIQNKRCFCDRILHYMNCGFPGMHRRPDR